MPAWSDRALVHLRKDLHMEFLRLVVATLVHERKIDQMSLTGENDHVPISIQVASPEALQ